MPRQGDWAKAMEGGVANTSTAHNAPHRTVEPRIANANRVSLEWCFSDPFMPSCLWENDWKHFPLAIAYFGKASSDSDTASFVAAPAQLFAQSFERGLRGSFVHK